MSALARRCRLDLRFSPAWRSVQPILPPGSFLQSSEQQPLSLSPPWILLQIRSEQISCIFYTQVEQWVNARSEFRQVRPYNSANPRSQIHYMKHPTSSDELLFFISQRLDFLAS